MGLSTPVSRLTGVGEKYLKKLHNLGIETVEDLLFYFPRKYNDFSQIIPINQVQLGEINTVCGTIWEVKNRRTPRRKMMLTTAVLGDDTGTIQAVWYNQPYLVESLKPEYKVILSGKVEESYGKVSLQNPVYEIVKDIQDVDKKKTSDTSDTFDSSDLTHAGRIVPVYSETEGLTSRWLRYKIKSLLYLVDQIQDSLPLEIKKSQNLLHLQDAIKQIHFPQDHNLLKKAKRRLSFDELFLIQVNHLKQKIDWQKGKGRVIKFDEKLTGKFVKNLPFTLTLDQKKAAWQILQDLQKSIPSNRLLEGEVGSGKTVVAVIAMLSVIKNGFQVAFMAPTEILAQQHYNRISSYLEPFRVKIKLLLGSTKKKEKEKIIKDISLGKVDLVIGTHALIQEGVKFKNLTLAIIDEQHRFGVGQRASLRQVSGDLYSPHLLTMSATPIPRTLALALYGDLDLSIISQLPPGRQKVITELVKPSQREKAYNFIREQIKKGRQAFVICPLIEESDKLGVKSVTLEYKKLSQKVFPNLKIGMLHGKLKSKEKEKIMKKFVCGDLDILVSTSVVEVGIDVGNATVMVIEGAERFGLAQLHQFRGRVGRSGYQSYCLLFCESGTKKTFARLYALIKSHDGFKLAEADLRIRGPGEIYGIRQHGIPDLKMASLTDIDLISQAREEANKLLQEDPQLKKYPKLVLEMEKFVQVRHLE
jgi:ATP-dependent DNA helicase RecG